MFDIEIQTLVPAGTEEKLTLAVEFNEPLLVLGQLGTARHLIDLSLQYCNLTVSPSLRRIKTIRGRIREQWFRVTPRTRPMSSFVQSELVGLKPALPLNSFMTKVKGSNHITAEAAQHLVTRETPRQNKT